MFEASNRVEVLRLAILLLSGMDPAELPKEWKSPEYVFPPGPAAEFGHCEGAIFNAMQREEHITEAMKCHAFMATPYKVGLTVSNPDENNSKRKSALKIRDSFDVIVAGAPCVHIMLAKAPNLFETQVCPKCACTVYRNLCSAIDSRV